jgi:hypothetical protein
MNASFIDDVVQAITANSFAIPSSLCGLAAKTELGIRLCGVNNHSAMSHRMPPMKVRG